MNISKSVKWLFAALLILTAVVAVFHLSTREEIPEQTLLVEYGGERYFVKLSSLPLGDIHGERFTGTGERREINAKGFPLTAVFDAVLSDYSDANQVTITAADGFSAIVTAQEWEQPQKVCLILQDDGQPQLIVFGDKDSKRSVKQVERMLLEDAK